MSIIIGGGVKHVTGNKTSGGINRFKSWYKKNHERAIRDILMDSPITTKKILLEQLLSAFRIGITCSQFLGYLHEQIAKTWLSIVDKWILEHPNVVTSTDDTHPHNYTAAMSRIKNLRFDGYNSELMLGFCPFEPLRRLQMLVEFPIEYFDPTTELDIGDFQDPPDFPEGDVELKNNSEKYEEILLLEPELYKWETYYDELCKNITKLCKQLENY